MISNKTVGDASAILLGLLTLTIQYVMASTQTWDGVNYTKTFNTSLTALGLGLILFGMWILIESKNIWVTAGKLTIPR